MMEILSFSRGLLRLSPQQPPEKRKTQYLQTETAGLRVMENALPKHVQSAFLKALWKRLESTVEALRKRIESIFGEIVKMAGKPYQSCLITYEKEIVALRRRKPPMPYPQIAALLREKYQITIGKVGIRDFVKRRAERDSKTCKYAWDIKSPEANNQPITEPPPMQKQTASKPNVSVVNSKPKGSASSFDPSKVEVTEYSPTWNLHRPKTAEEREAYRQYIREQKNNNNPQEN
jgi:hypothetical protein